MSKPFSSYRKVEFSDTDMAGIMHFSNFFRFMESAETEFLNSLGLSVTWTDNGVRYGFPRVSATCDYAHPAQFGDLIEIRVILEKIGSKSVTYRYQFCRDSIDLATGRIVAVFCRKGPENQIEPLVITPEIRKKLEQSNP